MKDLKPLLRLGRELLVLNKIPLIVFTICVVSLELVLGFITKHAPTIFSRDPGSIVVKFSIGCSLYCLLRLSKAMLNAKRERIRKSIFLVIPFLCLVFMYLYAVLTTGSGYSFLFEDVMNPFHMEEGYLFSIVGIVFGLILIVGTKHFGIIEGYKPQDLPKEVRRRIFGAYALFLCFYWEYTFLTMGEWETITSFYAKVATDYYVSFTAIPILAVLMLVVGYSTYRAFKSRGISKGWWIFCGGVSLIFLIPPIASSEGLRSLGGYLSFIIGEVLEKVFGKVFSWIGFM